MRTSGITGTLLIAVLAVIFAVCWLQERRHAANLTEEYQRLSRELAVARNVNEEHENSTAHSVTAESDAFKPSETVIGSEASNHTAISDAVATNNPPRMERVSAEPTATQSPSLPVANDEPPYTELQLEIYRCANQLGVINFAAERWAVDHKGVIPSDLMELRSYLPPMTLICPSVHPKSLSVAWENFTSGDITYQIVPGSKGKLWDFQIPNQGSPVTIRWLYCPIHKRLSVENRTTLGGIPTSQVFQSR